ncbi:MAG: glycoside hydrolase family 88 protein [Paludibacteraceae bacterium]|nr:glycoside hydrolase family 88 protein [Paludibacteraceae bacterium]
MKHVHITILSICIFLFLTACSHKTNTALDYKSYAVKLSNSQLTHDPQLWMADGVKKPKWDYTQGLVAKAVLATYIATGDSAYLRYVYDFADYFINEDGTIKTYKKSDYNIDKVNGGPFLFMLQNLCPEPRFAAAIDTLYQQLLSHPRTTEGGFWHKKIYPHQMWLDGLYMAEPFYAEYASAHGLHDAYTDIQLQFETIDRHTYDSLSGLNYHGWDEAREQIWADSVTGCSPHFWGRSMGWYMMAMADALDFIPAEHPAFSSIKSMLNRSAANILRYQDPDTGLWFQVLDMPQAEGNYQEATCSAIFCYTFAKAANKGYLPKEYKAEAERIFKGIEKHLLINNEDGTLSLTHCCSVAGLGGKQQRDGSYNYYISEPQRNDDPKGIGPLILATLELAK